MVSLSRAAIVAAVLFALAVAGCGGGGSPAPVSQVGGSAAPSASTAPTTAPAASGGGNAVGGPVAVGGDLCDLLAPGDFAAAGVTGTGAPAENNNPPTDYYCVYAGRSSMTGGIELDAFVLAAADDPDGVFDTVLNASGIIDRTERGPDVGADRAVIAASVKGDAGPVAIIAVRKGGLVFDIGFPGGPDAERQLIGLAKLVLERATALTRSSIPGSEPSGRRAARVNAAPALVTNPSKRP